MNKQTIFWGACALIFACAVIFLIIGGIFAVIGLIMLLVEIILVIRTLYENYYFHSKKGKLYRKNNPYLVGFRGAPLDFKTDYKP